MKPLLNIFIVVGLLLFFPQLLLSQDNNKIDSLLVELKKSDHDTLKIQIFLDIGNYYDNIKVEKAMEYYYKAINLCEDNLVKTGGLSEKKFKQQKALALQNIAYINRTLGDFVSSLELYFQALDIGESIICNEIIYSSLNNIGIVNHIQKDYDVAEEYYYKALDVAERANNAYGKSRLLNNMGVLYFEYGNMSDDIERKEAYFKKALDNYMNVLDIRIKLDDIRGQMISYNNLGNVISEGTRHLEEEKIIKDKLMQAVKYYFQSYNIAYEINDLITMSRVFGNLADVYLIIYNFKNITTNERISYADTIDYYITESYKYAEKTNSLPQKNDVAFMAMNILDGIGDADKALEFAKIHIEINKELFSEDKTRSLDELRISYETKKKENEILLLSRENELNQLNIDKAQRQRNSFIVSVFFLLIFTGLLYKLYQNRKKSARLLEEKNLELGKLNTTKDKFISILAHDLKNPFSSFLNITSTINNDFDQLDNNDKKQCLGQLHRSAEQVNLLLKNMLEWAVSKHKSTNPEIENLSLLEITGDTVNALSGFLEENGFVIDNKVPKNVIVRANKTHLAAILNNLITNAVKFSDTETKASVQAVVKDGYAKISVEDKGTGIAAEDINKLFRIDVDPKTIGKPKGKGTGMGLILCKELIENMNGKIWAESKPGKGSRFIFTLPIAQD